MQFAIEEAAGWNVRMPESVDARLQSPFAASEVRTLCDLLMRAAIREKLSAGADRAY